LNFRAGGVTPPTNFCPEQGEDKFLGNIGSHLQNNTAVFLALWCEAVSEEKALQKLYRTLNE
jgi:hypothetical protein